MLTRCTGSSRRWPPPTASSRSWKPLVRCHFACGWIHLGQHARAQREIDAALAAEAPDWMRAKALQMRARMRVGMGRSAREPARARRTR